MVAQCLYPLNVQVLMYLNDGLIQSLSEAQCLMDTAAVLELCQEMGLEVNKRKSILTPSQSIV